MKDNKTPSLPPSSITLFEATLNRITFPVLLGSVMAVAKLLGFVNFPWLWILVGFFFSHLLVMVAITSLLLTMACSFLARFLATPIIVSKSDTRGK